MGHLFCTSWGQAPLWGQVPLWGTGLEALSGDRFRNLDGDRPLRLYAYGDRVTNKILVIYNKEGVCRCLV